MKRSEARLLTWFKALVNPGGHIQVYSKDYGSVCTPVVDFAKFLSKHIYNFNMDGKWPMDFKTVFLNGYMGRDIYVYHLSKIPYHMQRNSYYLLFKSLYCLKQASLQWLTKLGDILKQFGIIHQIGDGTVFSKFLSERNKEI